MLAGAGLQYAQHRVPIQLHPRERRTEKSQKSVYKNPSHRESVQPDDGG